jgi:hypothetical protein
VEGRAYLILDSVMEAFKNGIHLGVLDGDWHWFDTIVDYHYGLERQGAQLDQDIHLRVDILLPKARMHSSLLSPSESRHSSQAVTALLMSSKGC